MLYQKKTRKLCDIMKLDDLNIEIYYDGSDRISDYLDKVEKAKQISESIASQ